MSFPRYAKYKDSGIEWLGEVPDHWGSPTKLGAISSLKGRLGWQGLKADEYCEDGPYVVSSAHFIDYKIQWDECPRVSLERYDLDNNIQLAENDVLLMKDGAAMGKLAFVDSLPGPACLNSHLLIFRPVKSDGANAYHPRFFFHFMNTKYFQDYIRVNGTGATFLGISQESIARYQIVFPPLEEQIDISKFLDHETEKIGALMSEQLLLIELLSEKRQAVISHAVTKGLNPHAPMKPSGIEWLGDVPGHWNVMRFQRYVDVVEGQVDPEDNIYSSMSLIAPNHIEPGTGRLLSLETADDQGPESGKYLCKAGDVVYSKIRPALRKVCIAPEDCLCSADMYPLRSHSGLTNPFLFWHILSEQFSALAVLESQRVAMPKINRESLKAVMFAMPPISEQGTIVAFLNFETSKLDALAAEAQRTIDLLQERRTALISAAVTGKIDVRGLEEAEAA